MNEVADARVSISHKNFRSAHWSSLKHLLHRSVAADPVALKQFHTTLKSYSEQQHVLSREKIQLYKILRRKIESQQKPLKNFNLSLLKISVSLSDMHDLDLEWSWVGGEVEPKPKQQTTRKEASLLWFS